MPRRRSPEEPAAIVDTTATLASLYQAPLADFIARRTAAVAQLRKSGHKDVAARLAASVKPSRAAFLVNQVYWTARPQYDAVLDTGTAARAAQQARLLGDDSEDLAERLAWRDQAIDDAIARAEDVADADGQPLTAALRAQVRASFEALAAHGRDGRLAHGHLTSDVPLPGLAALAGLVTAPETPGPVRRFEVVARRAPDDGPPPPPDPEVVAQEQQVAALRSREAEAVTRLEDVERAVDAATDVVTRAREEAEAAARRLAEAEASVRHGETMRAAAKADLERVVAEREEAERRLSGLQAPTPAPRGRGGPRSRR